jgi:hypothetical protein
MRGSVIRRSSIHSVQAGLRKQSSAFSTRGVILLLAVLALALGSWTSARAQVAGSGNLTGTVTDEKGAAVAGAKVAVRNSGTGIGRDLLTDSAGEFRALQVPPGTYDVTVQAPGFGRVKMTGIHVDVGATETIPITLRVAAVTEEVTVSGQAPVLETEKTEVSQTLSSNLASNLPINGRRWEQFVLLTPAVTTDGGFGLVSYRGISGLYNNNTVDGADNNQAFFSESRGRTRIAYSYSQDSISEFQVTSSNYSAEFGRAAGGIVNAVSKSGTNAYHGDLFWYLRQFHGNAYDPLTKFNAATRPGTVLSKPELLRNQFGADIGGPIKQNKLFFFASYDGQRRSFTGSITPGSASYFSPDTTGPNAGVANQTNCLAAGTSTVHPNAAQCTAAIAYLQSLVGNYAKHGDQDIGFGKIDWQANNKNRISGSLNWHRWDGPNAFTNAAPSANGNDVVRDRFVVVDWTWTPSSSKVNDLRFQYGQDFEAATPNASGPNVFITGLTSYGMPNSLPRTNYPDERRWQLTEGLSMISGKHTYKVGLDLNFVHEILANLFQGGGIYSYTGNQIPAFQNWVTDVFQLNTGANTGKHYSSTFTQAFDPVTGVGADDFWNTNVGVYFQDTWKLRSNLTVNYGLRWDIQTVPGPPMPNALTPLTKLYTSTLNIDKNNFGPRLGISWSPIAKTVVRAGYGLYYGQTSNSTFYALRVENGLIQETFQCFANSACGPVFPNVIFPPPGPPLAAPFAGAAIPQVVNTNPTLGTQVVRALAPDFVNPLVHMGELAIERELPGQFSVSATYLFSRGQRLPVFIDTNLAAATTTKTYDVTNASGNTVSTVTVPFYTARAPGNTGTGVILTGFSALNSWYHALVVSVQKHYGHGLEMLANFTWSKATDNGQVPGTFGTFNGTDTPLDPFNLKQEYAVSDLNQTKRFVASFVYTPPFFHNSSSSFVRKAFDGFAFSGILQLADGQPLTPFLTGSNTAAGAPGRCLIDGGVTCGEVNSNGGPSAGRVPFLGRNSVTQPGIQTFDFRVARRINFSERYKLMLAVEAFNLTNTLNIYSQISTAYALTGVAPTGLCKSVASGGTHTNPCLVAQPTFLSPSSGGTSSFNGNAGARQLQGTVRFSF